MAKKKAAKSKSKASMSKLSKQKKEKKDRKKKKKEKELRTAVSDSDSDSDSDNVTLATQKESLACLQTVVDRRQGGALAGASRKLTNSSNYYLRLMEDERPDIVKPGVKTIDAAEAELLDRYSREKAELFAEDAVYTNDNLAFEEEDRCFTRYSIASKYNEGRYSAVYVVTKQICKDNNTKDENVPYMLKTGLRLNSAKINLRTKRELKVMQDMAPLAKKNMILPLVIDSGKVCGMNYIIMTMFDMNLEKLRESVGGKFKPTSGFHIAQETLNCIAELHNKEYVHRDVKPTNFCISANPQLRSRIYLIDFGDTVKQGKKIKLGIPDAATLPFWSIECHRKDAATRRTDLESWYYMICDIVVPNGLPWRLVLEEDDALAAKTLFWGDLSAKVEDPALIAIGELINTRADFSKDDYGRISTILQQRQAVLANGSKLQLEWAKTTSLLKSVMADPKPKKNGKK